jgi:hypothetical protein
VGPNPVLFFFLRVLKLDHDPVNGVVGGTIRKKMLPLAIGAARSAVTPHRTTPKGRGGCRQPIFRLIERR